ncbi:putative lrr receptor-like serine/threonine-protein kinase [Quercus suber]|uniref:Lrr receptor-like serine/threonine-protein kinase n=1 Tax=Quercus suber TaxID=58331 RepID=A0AAW0JZR9_QUESU
MSNFLFLFAKFQGFISIDCGSDEDYIDEETGIPYKPDKDLIDTGIVKTVSPDSPEDLPQSQKNLRSFPQGTRNCYTLRPEQGKNNNYLIRARFVYGNYDVKTRHQYLTYILESMNGQQYPNDVYDRIWGPLLFDNWIPIATNSTNEIEKLKAGQQRELKINLNDERNLIKSVKLDYLNPRTIVQNDPPISGKQISFSIQAAKGTKLPPILNALEFFQSIELPNKTSSIDDDYAQFVAN